VNIPLVSVIIDRRETPHLPGSALSGEFQIDAVEADEISAVELSVLWYTEGKGDEDLGVHHFERFTSEDASSASLIELRKFSVALPRSPLSYEGVLIKLRWCVRVRVFLKSGRNYFAELPFRLGDLPPAQLVASPADTLNQLAAAAAQHGGGRQPPEESE
jgi:hypothetical protein